MKVEAKLSRGTKGTNVRGGMRKGRLGSEGMCPLYKICLYESLHI